MKTFCVLFLCIFLTVPYTSCQGTQNISLTGYQYSSEVNGWFKLQRVPATWNNAHTNCLQEGAQLASPINSKFLKEMMSIITKYNVYCGVFTGINDKMTPRHFSSIEGIPLEQIAIQFEEKQQQCPEEFGNWIVLRQSGFLDTVSIGDAYPYICYKKNYNVTGKDNTDGYEKDDRTGSFYKFHREGATWSEAASTCISEGAHLAIINSAAEAKVLKDIFSKHPAKTLKSAFKNSALVGISDWGKPRGWLTINGQSLDTAGYSTWSPNQPDHSRHPDGKELGLFCGAIFRTGLLDDIWCDVKCAFICERTPIDIENFNFGEGVIDERFGTQ